MLGRAWFAVLLAVGGCGSDGSAGGPDAAPSPDAPSGSINVTVTPSTLTVPQGETVEVTVSVSRQATTAPVIVTLSSLPAGISAGTITLVEGSESGRITVSAAPDATRGNNDLQVVASAGPLVATAPLTVTVVS